MRKRILFVLICSLAVVFTFTCNQTVYAALAGPNNISVTAQPIQPVLQQTQTPTTIYNIQLELAKEQLRGDFYKQTLTILVAFFSILVAIILSLIAYVRWSNKKEYEKAVSDADKALDRIQLLSDKAESHCEKARNYEQQAQEKLASIDQLVTEKLNEMNKQAEDNRKDIERIVTQEQEKIIAEAERQREVSELKKMASKLDEKGDFQSAADYYKKIVEDFKEENEWVFNNWGTVLHQLANKKDCEQADKLFTQACEKYQKAVVIKPDDYQVFYNWGTALDDWAHKKDNDQADKLFSQACEKYQKAIYIKQDDYDTLYNWGGAFLSWSKLKTGKERDEMLKQAEEILLNAESIKTGSGSYNLACLYGIRGDKENCRKWLETAEKARTIETREDAMKEEDLKIVRDEEWFKKLRFKGE